MYAQYNVQHKHIFTHTNINLWTCTTPVHLYRHRNIYLYTGICSTYIFAGSPACEALNTGLSTHSGWSCLAVPLSLRDPSETLEPGLADLGRATAAGPKEEVIRQKA